MNELGDGVEYKNVLFFFSIKIKHNYFLSSKTNIIIY